MCTSTLLARRVVYLYVVARIDQRLAARQDVKIQWWRYHVCVIIHTSETTVAASVRRVQEPHTLVALPAARKGIAGMLS